MLRLASRITLAIVPLALLMACSGGPQPSTDSSPGPVALDPTSELDSRTDPPPSVDDNDNHPNASEFCTLFFDSAHEYNPTGEALEFSEVDLDAMEGVYAQLANLAPAEVADATETIYTFIQSIEDQSQVPDLQQLVVEDPVLGDALRQIGMYTETECPRVAPQT